MNRFTGKVAFVTGGASGLGEATARLFAAEGAKVVIADINEAGARAVAESLPEALAIRVDTSDEAAVEQAIAKSVETYPNIAPYTFTKWGIIGLTKSVAIEYAKHHIRVNAVAPTVVRTALVEKFIQEAADPAEMAQRMENFNPMPGMPEPRDVAAAVAFLASDDARFITGHVIPIDGGYTAQ
ncbi:MAG: SDR family NAD(P)-dependent oxidoreductase [Candidatus Sericytochromatia bacterium]